ncbi:hypothetical protein J6590_004459 [Homalodisca vitripennis]|nr:hypothetical protein J6590_004459 [Homalodisca vitripennis]
MLGVKLGYAYFGLPSEVIGERFGIQVLHSIRRFMDLMFLLRFINNYLDCPGLLCVVDFIVHRGPRSRSIFQRRFMPTQYSYRSDISRLLLAGSELQTGWTFSMDPRHLLDEASRKYRFMLDHD